MIWRVYGGSVFIGTSRHLQQTPKLDWLQKSEHKPLCHLWKCVQTLHKQSKNYRIFVQFLVRLLAYCVRSPVAERRTLRLQSVVSIELVEVSRELSAPLQVRTEPQMLESDASLVFQRYAYTPNIHECRKAKMLPKLRWGAPNSATRPCSWHCPRFAWTGILIAITISKMQNLSLIHRQVAWCGLLDLRHHDHIHRFWNFCGGSVPTPCAHTWS